MTTGALEAGLAQGHGGERRGGMPAGLDGEAAAVSVIVCAYTERRWEQTVAALRSVLGQRPAPAQALLVVDHNPELAARARACWPAGDRPGVTVLESDEPPGLSGARNCGLRHATQPVAAFLDDDACARPGWLAALTAPYADEAVVATGGGVHPVWPGRRPSWLPPTFDWVVGCSYLGLPESVGEVRNPIGANMSMRTELARRAGGFDGSVGRVGTRPRGCEETELAIRLTAGRAGAVVLHVPRAEVDHHVSADRVRPGYYLRRCWHEGVSKAEVVRLAGARDGLGRERRHVAAVLPAAMANDLRGLARGDLAGAARFAAAVAGLGSAACGYLGRRARLLLARRDRGAGPAALAALEPAAWVHAE